MQHPYNYLQPLQSVKKMLQRFEKTIHKAGKTPQQIEKTLHRTMKPLQHIF